MLFLVCVTTRLLSCSSPRNRRQTSVAKSTEIKFEKNVKHIKQRTCIGVAFYIIDKQSV